MTYGEAKKALRKVGCAHASGEALAAMYAEVIITHKGINARVVTKFYDHFRKEPDDDSMFCECRRMITDPFAIFDVI